MPAPIFFLILSVIAAVITLPIVITSMAFKQKRWKMEFDQGKTNGGNADELSKSELKELIRETMQEANVPLIKRIEALEKSKKLDLSDLKDDLYNLSSQEKSMGKGKVQS